MEKLPLQEKITEITETLKRRIGAAMIAGLERFDDAHDIDWGIEDDEDLSIPDNIVLGEE